MSSLNHPNYRADIDGLRGVAILCVLGFHAFPDLIKGGFIGVDIFFVISGFLISIIILESLKKNTFSFIEFYSRRIRRIFPALIVVLLVSCALGWFIMLPYELKLLGKHIAAGAGFSSNFILWNESGYFDSAAETKPLLHLWSLGIEEQFYIIWPFLLWFGWKNKFNLLAITLSLAVISFGLNIIVIHSDLTAAFYSPVTRFWEIMTGAILAHMSLTRQESVSKLQNIKSIIGAVLILIAIILLTKEARFPGWWAILPTLGAALIISSGPQAWLNRVILSNYSLVWFGLISYPLYLWHWPLLTFSRLMKGPSVKVSIAVVIISIVLSWATYKIIENPIRRGKHNRTKILVLVVLMVFVGFTGIYCYKNNGFDFRIPKDIRGLLRILPANSEARIEGSCLVTPNQDYTAFSKCITPVSDKKMLLIWGDSTADSLFPGYKTSFYAKKFNIVERTTSFCGPILDIDFDSRRPNCMKNVSYILNYIKENKPSKIVLEANWNYYGWGKIKGTIDYLRKMGINDIDLIGSPPTWNASLPRLVYMYYQSVIPHHIPKYMKFGLNSDYLELDSKINHLAKKLNVNYISLRDILCNEKGCSIFTGKTADELTTWDTIHLTPKTSQFVVSTFSK